MMFHSLLTKLEKVIAIESVSAHCDVPCGVYDPSAAQVAALSVVRFIDLIEELNSKDELTLADQAKLARLVREKEIHAKKVKDEIIVIWGDYFKQPQFDKFPDTHTLVHKIMMAGSACKQGIDRQSGLDLVTLVNEFAVSFWTTKGVDVVTAKCPYAPALDTVYPKLF